MTEITNFPEFCCYTQLPEPQKKVGRWPVGLFLGVLGYHFTYFLGPGRLNLPLPTRAHLHTRRGDVKKAERHTAPHAIQLGTTSCVWLYHVQHMCQTKCTQKKHRCPRQSLLKGRAKRKRLCCQLKTQAATQVIYLERSLNPQTPELATLNPKA